MFDFLDFCVGNFGTMGQYAIHFHLAGYAKSFRGYLPVNAKARGYSRELRVVSCSIWRTYVRWITIHGAMEVEIRNNVAFLTYGSGFFVEDGTEVHNVFDHNMGIMAMTAVQNAYWNPGPIYPYVSSDYGPMSVFWFKNNQNVCTRNVMANCPTPVLGVWYVPQKIGRLRGPSAVCIGSELLGLPAIASESSAVGKDNSGLNLQLESNANGAKVKFETIKHCGSDGKSYCACYVPPDFDFPLLSPLTGCSVYTGDNQGTPLMTNSENVVYNMAGFYSEFPEGLSGGPLKYLYNHGGGRDSLYPIRFPNGVPSGIPGCGRNQQFNSTKQGSSVPKFMPAGGQNDCTDGDIAIGIYPCPGWNKELRYQPISPPDYDALEQQCNCQTGSVGVMAKQTPKMIANLLLWNTGPLLSGLFYGAGWSKDVPPMFINCAFLADQGVGAATVPEADGLAQASTKSASNFVWVSISI
jgi:hypothetical protein